MNCKNCQTELEEGVTLCPNCGTENAEPVECVEPAVPAEPAEPAKNGLGAGKIALLVVLAVAAIAVIVALLMGGQGGTTPVETTLPTESLSTTEPTGSVAATVPADGNPDDVTCQGSYSVTDDEMAAAAQTVVATMGESKLTNEELQVYYWMQVIDFLNQYASYASMFGLDYTQPLDTQVSIDGNLTWQQYFLDSALDTWTNYQAMCHAAIAAGYELDEEYALYLEELPVNLEENALTMGFESADAMIKADMGPGATLDGYMSYLNNYYLGYMYYGDHLEQIPVTDADVEAYFDAHAEEYKANGLEKTDECYVDVRHILISPEGGTTNESGATVYSDAEWAAAEAKANDVLNEWLTKNPTEDGFAVLAQAYSVDPGSASNGGLYEGVYVGQMVEPFENWCFDESRQYGDYGIVKTNYGYHIMYFVGSDLVWFQTAESDMMVEKGNEFLTEIVEQNPAQIDYSAIALGNVNLAQ